MANRFSIGLENCGNITNTGWRFVPTNMIRSQNQSYQTTCWASTYLGKSGDYLLGTLSVSRNRVTGAHGITFVTDAYTRLDRTAPVSLRFFRWCKNAVQLWNPDRKHQKPSTSSRSRTQKLKKMLSAMKRTNGMTLILPTDSGKRKISLFHDRAACSAQIHKQIRQAQVLELNSEPPRSQSKTNAKKPTTSVTVVTKTLEEMAGSASSLSRAIGNQNPAAAAQIIVTTMAISNHQSEPGFAEPDGSDNTDDKGKCHTVQKAHQQLPF